MDPSSVTVSDELRKKFPELVELILGSESMNNEERQYWINILPAMTPEQVANLQQILQNEKDQLAAIDQRYTKEAQGVGSARAVEEIGAERKKKKMGRVSLEEEAEKSEREREEQVLKEIEGLSTM